ncbi:MAG: glycosyltransferase, partial [Gammaproteobacteria bacterium]
MGRLSVIVPALNEATVVRATLTPLQPLRERGHEVILVDGGSSDGTPELAASLARVVRAPRGRARQMNAGAKASRGTLLLFLHADTSLGAGAAETLLELAGSEGPLWGRFDVLLSGAHPLLRVVERMMNLRSRLTGIATGDQALFVSRRLFFEVGGFPEQPLMEDVALSALLRRRCRPLCLRQRVITSSRRWERDG